MTFKSGLFGALLAVVGASYLATNPAKADLGSADITGPSGDTSSGQTYQARCGQSQKKCTVSFKNGKMMINNEGGIYSDQFLSVVKARTCRQKAVLMQWVKSCFRDQYDYDFTITYRTDDARKKSALIAFRPGYFLQGVEAHASFRRDLQVWTENFLRPIGPSVRIESGPQARPSSRPQYKSQELPLNCKIPLSDYKCDWSNYLDGNPNVKAWAEANPAMAEKERIRLGGSI